MVQSLHGQMPDVKDIVCSVNPGGAAKEFRARLEEIYGIEALSLPNNPALKNTILAIAGAGNDLIYHPIKGKRDKKDRRYYDLQNCPKEIRDDYAAICNHAQAFGGSVWFGIGSAAVYSGKEWGDNHGRYKVMTQSSNP